MEDLEQGKAWLIFMLIIFSIGFIGMGIAIHQTDKEFDEWLEKMKPMDERKKK